MVAWISRLDGQMSRRYTGAPSASSPSGLLVEVDVAAAREGVGDHERRRREEVHPDLGVHSPFEVPVAGECGADDEIAVPDGGADLFGQGTGVADAGRAPESDDVEAETFEVFEQSRLLEIVLHHHGARGEARLDPGLHHETACAGVAREQPGSDQHRGVRCVGARGDRRDHHRAVAKLVAGSVLLHGDAAVAVAAFRLHRLEMAGDHRLRLSQRDPVLRPLRPGDAGLDRAHVEDEGVGVVRRSVSGLAKHALGTRVCLHQRDLRFVAAGEAQVLDALRIDGEDAAGRSVLGGHVRDGGAIGERQVVEPVAVELDELADHALRAKHLHHGKHEVGRSGALGEPAGELEADHLGDEHRDRLAEHRGLRLDSPDSPTQHPEAVDHGGVRVGADHGVRIGAGRAVVLAREHDAGEVLQVDLMDDAGAGRHHLEVPERLLAPAQERVALAVALELDLGVARKGVAGSEPVDLHRVVDDELDRRERVDLRGVAAEGAHRVAHRREIDHRRNPREVLEQHPGGSERDLDGRLRAGVPSRQRLDVARGDVHRVFVAEQVFEEDLQRVGQAAEVMAVRHSVEPEYLVLHATDDERRSRAE